ncbi:hypothetical protein TRFO_20771 [Tritrichomonas foetus]|uniref:Uncharacterized protein n=1 Tax=Tritrichomonas foetus TaxID=1144522 RepID=A0A1J4KJU5_9EUKA|nr:hypothetical protein TRFO_20771 [Tritrichomonas foetus]|eukprot:OHT10116.1 hypothetical protein TRFO_20771 [Tritrichomonas foetus]
MNFNFWGNNPAEKNEEKDSFQLTEQMLLTELPGSVAKDFLNIYNNIVENRKFINENKITSAAQTVSEKDIQFKISNLNENANSELLNNLSSLAHLIDFGRKTLKEFQEDLQISKKDYSETDQLQSFPSPFMIRFSKQLEQTAENISQEIIAYGSHFQPTALSEKENILFHFFKEESNAILRISSRISNIKRKYSATRTLLCNKLRIPISQTDASDLSLDNSYANTILSKYKHFRAEQKSKIQKNSDDSDIFGMPTHIENNASSSMASTWGTSSFTNNLTQRRANSTFNPPPPKINTAQTTSILPTSAPEQPPAPSTKGKNPFSDK